MPLFKVYADVRFLPRYGGLVGRAVNYMTHRVPRESFAFAAVLREACALACVAAPSMSAVVPAHLNTHGASDAAATTTSSSSSVDGGDGVACALLPPDDMRWWDKLCAACARKATSRYGSWLLHRRLVHALAQRLAVDAVWRRNATELEREHVTRPLVILGLPRSHGHYVAHLFARSGLFLAPLQCDTFAPATMSPQHRARAFRRSYGRAFTSIHRDFATVRMLCGNRVDDDLALHLLTPQSYAWGLLHGLDDYLLECLEEDQTPVYARVKQVMQLYAWYKRCGQMSEPVVRECTPTSKCDEQVRYGGKPQLPPSSLLPLLYSPLAILCSDALHATFPDLRAVWVHRPLAQCVPSLCSSLCLHDALYTGRPPSDSQLVAMGEKVLGIFGSGSEHAVAFYGNFDQRRMLHWGSRDVVRHAVRLAQKTLRHFDISLDYYRRIQMIDGHTEYISDLRPTHNAELSFFGMRDAAVHAAFRDYVHQFDEFAIDNTPGITVSEDAPKGNAARYFAEHGGVRNIIGDSGMREPSASLPPPPLPPLPWRP